MKYTKPKLTKHKHLKNLTFSCDHEFEQVDVEYKGYGAYDGTHKRPRCKKCGFIYL